MINNACVLDSGIPGRPNPVALATSHINIKNCPFFMSTWSCPNCGAVNPAPIHNRPEITCAACAASFIAEYTNDSAGPTVTSKPFTIELTSKHYKKKQLICYVLMLIGISGCVVGGPTNSGILIISGFGTFLLGAAWLLIVRAQIWWNHG